MKYVYERNGDLGGVKVWPSKRGWIIETWSRLAGVTTGTRVLYYYGGCCPRDADWSVQNCLVSTLLGCYAPDRVLRRGEVVR